MSTLAVNHLTKSFGAIRVLNGVSLTMKTGSIHGLVGANGAGKSTFINILSGMFSEYGGAVTVDGQPVSLHSPVDAHREGIRTVHQEFDISLFPNLSILENLLLPRRDHRFSRWWFPNKESRKWAQERLQTIKGNAIPLDQPIHTLRPAERQKVAIANALDENAKFIIFDEPTASLTAEDGARLIELLRELRERGVGILYVSHHLNEVFELANEVSVFREGELVDHFEVTEESRKKAELRVRTVRAMLNKDVSDMYSEVRPFIGQYEAPLLVIRNLGTSMGIRNVNLEIRPGEIVAVTGLMGGGKTELLRAIYGLDPIRKGEILWRGESLKNHNARTMIKRGIGFVPEDRHHLGLHLEHSVLRNLSLPTVSLMNSAFGVVVKSWEIKFGEELRQRVGLVAPTLHMSAKRLSGGNQQKVVLAKWLPNASSLLMLDEPTKGVDIGARSDFYKILKELAVGGVAILMATSEIEEALGNANRIVVMRRGQVVFEAPNKGLDADVLMKHATTGIGGSLVHG
ncbi:MAG: sugar ABC transporter ATP-binding protein [Bacilli bacterium]